MMPVTESDIVDAIRGIINQRKLKLVDLANDLQIPYRNLQNYMYKKARMPLDVYVKLCERIGITADYPIKGKFKIEHHDLQQSLIDVFGQDFFNSVDLDDQGRWVAGERRPLDVSRVRRMAGVFAVQVNSRYEHIREVALTPEEPDE